MNKGLRPHLMPRLLIVDDQPANISLLKQVFAINHELVSLHSGSEALCVLGRQSVDVVLLSLLIPDMSGLDVLLAIRNTTETADLPVLVLSELHDTNMLAEALRCGANDYTAKPFDAEIVRARVHNLVAQKRLTDELKQEVAELKAINQMKDDFMRIASHDLRSPLNNLLLLNQLLRGFAADHPEMNTYLELARENINLMGDFIEQFLEAEMLKENGLNVHVEPLPVCNIIERVIRHYSMLAEKKSIILQDKPSERLVIADPNRLVQILGNLVSNAIKYSPPGSTVTITIDEDSQGVVIHVTDEGPGIPDWERQRLFQPFSKLSARPTNGENSIGLGLWIVKQLATLQQGDVGVDCPQEGGSDFWIRLPSPAAV